LSESHQARNLGSSYQILLYELLVSVLFIIYFVAWHGDPAKSELLWTFLGIWIIVSPILTVLFFLGATGQRSWLPFGAYPKNMNLGLALVLGLIGSFTMILTSAGIAKYGGGMALIAMPELIEQLISLFKALPFPRLPVRFIPLEWLSGIEAVGWQAVVSGVEEAMQLALTLAVALILYAVVRWRKGTVSPNQRRFILAFAVAVMGGFWVVLHGLKNYHYAAEYASAFAAVFIKAVPTYLFGNLFPAFFMHWLYNIFAPVVTTALAKILAFAVASILD